MIRSAIGLSSLALLALTGCAMADPAAAPAAPAAASAQIPLESADVASPSGELRLSLTSVNTTPHWQAFWRGQAITDPSALGLSFATGRDLNTGLVLAGASTSSHDETWEQPWGERRFVRDRHTELVADYAFTDGTPAYTLRVRVFDDGLGFRYEVPDHGDRAIIDERTEFRLDPDARTWWIGAGKFNRYEYLYEETPLRDVVRAHTPMTLQLPSGGPYVSIHEAALVDYAGMWLDQRRDGELKASLAPWSDGAKVKVSGAFKTPWRTLQVSDTAAGLANSDLILNLNEPNALGDVSWAKPAKYVGIWWCMHINECTWGSGDSHGATTERTRDYIDFAAEHGFDGVLVEGWNRGWDGDWMANGEAFSFTQAYPDFDLEALAAYAIEKGVYLIGHHETAAAITSYEAQMQDAYALYARLGIPTIKTGYVADGGEMLRRDGDGKGFFEWHDGQASVRHHLHVLREAARYQLSINAHEPVKDTGLRRTYPNALSREGARGQEFNAWGAPPNDPAHTTELAFTRMLAGPMDFTPGIFDLSFGKPLDQNPRVQTTLAKQLALYVVLYSPVQMAADLPRNYLARPDAFQFIKDVPVDWEQSIMLDGAPGEFVITARQERGTNAWFLGAITDENARTLEVALDFLGDTAYEAQIYRDGPDADWLANPYSFETAVKTVGRGDTLSLDLAPGGGAAIAFIPVE